MSSEKISLQPQGYAEEEKEEEKSEPGGLQERLQEDSGCKKAGNQAHRTKTTCRDIFITVTNLLGFAFVNAAVSVIHPFYPIEALKYNVSFYVVGFVIGTAPLCTFLLSPVFGFFLPQLGLKFMQVAGLFLGGGSLFLFGFVSIMPTRTLFIAFSFLLRIVEGIGTAMFSTASFTLLTQLYSEKKGAIVGLIELAISIGYIVGAPIGGGLQEAGGFTLPFILAGGCALTITIILFMLVQPRVLSPIISITGLAAIGANYGRFLYLKFHLRVGIIGAIDLVRSGMYVIASMLAGVLTDKLVPRCLILAGLVISGVGCIFIGPAEFVTTPKLWLSIIAAGVVGFGTPFAAVPVYSDLYKVALKIAMVTDVDAITNVLSGITVASMTAGGFVGPIIGGALVTKLHFQSAGLVIGVTIIGYAVVLLIISVLYKIKFRDKDRSEPATVST